MVIYSRKSHLVCQGERDVVAHRIRKKGGNYGCSGKKGGFTLRKKGKSSSKSMKKHKFHKKSGKKHKKSGKK